MEHHPSATAPLYTWINGRRTEVFYCDAQLAKSFGGASGWWWWSCYPGCLPNGDALGPFGSAYLALKDATLAQCVGATTGLYPGPFGRRPVPLMNEKASR
jgi:hypothetical protein